MLITISNYADILKDFQTNYETILTLSFPLFAVLKI